MKKNNSKPKKFISFKEADTPKKWKQYLGELKDSSKAEQREIVKGMKTSKKKLDREIKNPKNYPGKKLPD